MLKFDENFGFACRHLAFTRTSAVPLENFMEVAVTGLSSGACFPCCRRCSYPALTLVCKSDEILPVWSHHTAMSSNPSRQFPGVCVDDSLRLLAGEKAKVFSPGPQNDRSTDLSRGKDSITHISRNGQEAGAAHRSVQGIAATEFDAVRVLSSAAAWRSWSRDSLGIRDQFPRELVLCKVAAMGKWRAHVVVMPMFSANHSTPLLDFAIRLAGAAVKVTILSAEYHVNKVWNDALYWHWAPRLRAAGDAIDIVPVKDGIYDGTHAGFLRVVMLESSEAKFIAAFEAHLAPLMSGIAAPPPCCIVSDMLLGWTQTLAAQFGIPRYVLHIQPASNVSFMLHVPNLVAAGRLPLTDDNRTKPVEIPGFKYPVDPSNFVADVADPDQIKLGTYDMYLRMSRRVREAPMVLVNTFREFEEDVFKSFDDLRSHATKEQPFPKAIPIGPLLLPDDFPSPGAVEIKEDLGEESASLMEWLDSQAPRSVLYIAFGTLVRNKKERLQEIAFALEACKQPFVWLAGSLIKRPNEPPPPHVSEFLSPGFEERTRGQGKVVTVVVPQVYILGHPACGAFLCHCGWNSVLESITNAVPIIAWPQQFEQFMTARYLVDTVKVAVELVEEKRGLVRSEEIQRVVRLVMHEAEGVALRARVAEWKQSAAQYAHSNPHLDAFVAGLCE